MLRVERLRKKGCEMLQLKPILLGNLNLYYHKKKHLNRYLTSDRNVVDNTEAKLKPRRKKSDRLSLCQTKFWLFFLTYIRQILTPHGFTFLLICLAHSVNSLWKGAVSKKNGNIISPNKSCSIFFFPITMLTWSIEPQLGKKVLTDLHQFDHAVIRPLEFEFLWRTTKRNRSKRDSQLKFNPHDIVMKSKQ